MRIIVDADACPVTDIVERVAREKQIELLLFCDTSHELTSDYAEIVTVSKGADAADFALLNRAEKGDIIVTQDYGVAAMALGKGAAVIHQSGRQYTDDTIDQMLFERHIRKEARRNSKKIRGKGQKKRKSEDDLQFEKAFRLFVERYTKLDNN